jgi:hypothetical protein
MKKRLSACTVFVTVLLFALVSWAADFDGQADNQIDSLGWYYAITGGRFPNGQTYNGDNASGGTFRFLLDDPAWGYPIQNWRKDDWFPENAGLALTMKYEDSVVYDNNGIEEGDPDAFYHEDTNANLAGLYRGYCMSNNWDWIYSGYFKLNSPTTIDTIIGYFDCVAGLDPDSPHIAYRMNIWSSIPDGAGLIPAVNSFTGDVFSTDSTSGTFSWSDTEVDRYYSGWPAPHTDDIFRLVFGLDEPITLQPGEYFFSHDAVITAQIVATPNPVAVGADVTLTAVVKNNGDENEIVSACYSLDGGDEEPMDVPNNLGYEAYVAATVNVSEPGIYNLCAYAKDEAGATFPEVCTLLVVYDPDGGFVTGGGWIDSPSGAYKLHDMDVETVAFFNGFETDIDGWFTPTRVMSGNNGVPSASGDYHAEATAGDFTR